MSIQESLNQMLYSASITSGLYAQSPTGKKRDEIRTAEKEAKFAAKKTSEGVIAATKSEGQNTITPERLYEGPVGQSIETFGGKEVAARQRLFELKPSDKNYEAYQTAKASYERFMESKRRFREDSKVRRQLLENSPELNVNRTKINLGGVNNGQNQ